MQSHLQSRFVCFSCIIRNEAFGFVIESGFSQIWKNWSRQRQRFDLGLFFWAYHSCAKRTYFSAYGQGHQLWMGGLYNALGVCGANGAFRLELSSPVGKKLVRFYG